MLSGSGTFSLSWGQEVSKNNNIVIQQPFALKMDLIKEPPDDKGTDVSNIYSIVVAGLEEKVSSSVYTIRWFLDDRYAGKFSGEKFPFSFKQNFKGLPGGRHQIRVEIYQGENDEDILAQASTEVSVIHEK